MKKMHLVKWAGLSLELLTFILIIMLLFLNRPVPGCPVALFFGGLVVCLFASCSIAVNSFPRLKTVYKAGKIKVKRCIRVYWN
ncbi:MAG: hypothetical protein GX878_05575 [Firmicutes bacterium]|nr:hypothetical protein [Bacillota bacterium]